MSKTPPVYLEPLPEKLPPRNAELEKIILDKPDDPASYLVYADWLTQHGDPRGELIVVQNQGNAEREKELLEQHYGSLLRGIAKGGPKHFERAGSGIVDVTWRWGFFDSVRLFNVIDWMDGKFPSREVCARVFQNPAALTLREIKVGVLRWEYQADDVKALIEEAGKAPFAARLATLRLGDVAGIDIDCAHHPLGDLGAISKTFPRLRELTMWGCELSLGTIDLPELRKLAVQTCGLPSASLQSITAATFPALEHLEIWFGSEDYGNDCSIDELGPIFDGTKLPKVKHLGLMNCPFTDEIAARLGSAKILSRLTELDLSKGTMSDEGARALLADGAAFRHLKKIDVSENFLSEDVIGELAGLGPEIVSNDQKDDEDDFRYVSVAE